jgi:hypothetical protein
MFVHSESRSSLTWGFEAYLCYSRRPKWAGKRRLRRWGAPCMLSFKDKNFYNKKSLIIEREQVVQPKAKSERSMTSYSVSVLV